MARTEGKGKTTTVTATELFKATTKVISRVQFGGERIVITRHGKPAAVLSQLSPSDIERLGAA